MARKTKEESQKTRDAILDGAERVFLLQGVANATMAQIADAAGVSRGAVYGHYDNKMEVCRAMVDRVFELDALRFPAEQASAGETLVAVGMYYLRQFHEPGPAQRVTEFLYHKCERNEENRGILRRRELMDRATMHYVRRQLRRAIALEELPQDIEVGIAAEFLVRLFEGMYGMMDGGKAPFAACERILRGAWLSLATVPAWRAGGSHSSASI
ncbi:TetR family transcriptional regulator [Chromobacterium haemolyticum]|uniref:TetR family transcriptional regulator n=1 Tax=Chromobacterium haemolyticum TaxID=394935 RepID=UPI0040554DBD